MKITPVIYDRISFVIVLKTLFTWILVGIFLLLEYVILIPPLLLWSFLFEKKPKRLLFNFTRSIVKFYLTCYFTSDFTIDLSEITAPNGPRVYVLNHASNFDTFLMYLLPGRIRVLVKENYLKIPFIGWTIRLTGNIVVKKPVHSQQPSDPTQKAIQEMQNKSTILIFPEGTRSKDGNIGRFKTGGFKIAYETEAEIVPVVLDTWNSIRPSGGWWIRDDKIWMKALPPFKYNDYKDMDMKDFSKMLRYKMSEELIKIRNIRRDQEKNYYRKDEKYIALDNKALSKISQYKTKAK